MTKEISRSEMLVEAVARMKILEMDKNLIKEFNEEEKLYYSDPQGFLFWFKNATSKRNQKYVPKAVFDALKSFEKRTGCLVYHVIHSFNEMGTMWSFMYVSKDVDEWKFEKEDLENGFLYAYVYNCTYPELSEAGSIMVRPQSGGVVRTA